MLIIGNFAPFVNKNVISAKKTKFPNHPHEKQVPP